MIYKDNNDIDNMSAEELEEYIKIAQTMTHKFDKMQHSAKILLNSLYGAMGTPYFRFFNIFCAEAITLTGQTCTAQSYDVFNTFLQGMLKDKIDRVIAGDTDSAYVDLSDLIMKLYGTVNLDEVIDNVTKLCDGVLATKLEDRFMEFAQSLNSMKNTIDMKREVIGRAVFVAKKNNVIEVYDNEGIRYASPKQKITGLEAIRSSTPKFFQEKLKQGYKILFQDDESNAHSFVEKVHNETLKLSPDSVAGVSTANNIENFLVGDCGYASGTPKHIKGAIAYNYLIRNSDEYQPIRSGDKVSVIQLKVPNPINSPVLAYNEKFPSDLLDEMYVDRELDYQKYFIKPYQRVLSIINWNTEHVFSLDDLFM